MAFIDRKMRSCLACNKMFMSESNGNRICHDCKVKQTTSVFGRTLLRPCVPRLNRKLSNVSLEAR